ncbi:MAG: riboflavin deaminase [Rhizobiales bacterium 24-66-13]|jgi:riboflavin biosynthesis pyrimidine reductase|nr:MAG: riboflavin deaminase [Rhizobiales bacterium 12-68-15]OYZ81841.1 MAG: riboflavin deaminase [Rhizobiales bacterium 24-66-13]OZB11293.1 MAG: riboflavin deaminase [Rhizobiales bacterium 39-66-18]
MKPYVVCLMETSLDGRLHPSRFTAGPQGGRADWGRIYEQVHGTLKADAWLVGRVTMAEMAKGVPHPPATVGAVARPLHVATRAESYAIALDPSGKVHFKGSSVGGDHAIVLLGGNVPDSHLAELAADGVSYIVAEGAEIDLAATLEILAEEFGIKRLAVEGGARANGAFLAAGLVDAFSVLIVPALDARPGSEAIVDAGPDGLAGKVTLSFLGAETLDHGVVHLRYAVKPA